MNSMDRLSQDRDKPSVHLKTKVYGNSSQCYSPIIVLDMSLSICNSEVLVHSRLFGFKKNTISLSKTPDKQEVRIAATEADEATNDDEDATTNEQLSNGAIFI